MVNKGVDTSQTLPLNSGGKYIIRPIQHDDRSKLLTLFDSLSAKSRYFRFAHSMSALPEAMLQHLLSEEANNANEITLVAEVPFSESTINHPIGESRIVGISRCVGSANQPSCEFSLSVSDDFHGEGVGFHLIQSMINFAHHKGFKDIYGYVLKNNYEMLELMTHLGFSIKDDTSEDDFKLVRHTV
jgi:acetyltransferase